jgi:hypothetical protein
MWTLSGLRVCIVWAINLGKVGYVYGGSGHTNLSTKTEDGEGCLPAEDGSRGAPFIGEAGRPVPTGLGGRVLSPSSVFLQHDHFSSVTFLPACSTSCTAQTLSSTPCIIGPSTWCFMLWVMSMLPCSTCFTCHHEFPAKLCLLPTHACPLHVVLMKVDERASNGACMINFN